LPLIRLSIRFLPPIKDFSAFNNATRKASYQRKRIDLERNLSTCCFLFVILINAIENGSDSTYFHLPILIFCCWPARRRNHLTVRSLTLFLHWCSKEHRRGVKDFSLKEVAVLCMLTKGLFCTPGKLCSAMLSNIQILSQPQRV
jgi:hypothetical protein